MNRQDTFRIMTVMVLLATGMLAFYSPARAEEREKRENHEKQRNFKLKDQDGKVVSLKDFEGKVVVLEWANIGCPFTRAHHSEKTMQGLADKWSKKGVVWLAIDSTHNQKPEKNREHREKHKLTYPILNDSSGEVGKAYRAMTTPHMFILDKNHKIVYRGAIDDDPGGEKRREGKALNYVDQALTELFAGEKLTVAKTHSYGCTVKYRP